MEDIKKLKDKVKDLKVLFVDDDHDFRENTAVFLRKFFDNVVVCTDGEEAFDKFMQQKDFNIIITDIMMPKMDGTTLLKKIKEAKPDIFTVVVTASKGAHTFDDSMCDISLQKPISFEDITMIIKQAGSLR